MSLTQGVVHHRLLERQANACAHYFGCIFFHCAVALAVVLPVFHISRSRCASGLMASTFATVWDTHPLDIRYSPAADVITNQVRERGPYTPSSFGGEPNSSKKCLFQPTSNNCSLNTKMPSLSSSNSATVSEKCWLEEIRGHPEFGLDCEFIGLVQVALYKINFPFTQRHESLSYRRRKPLIMKGSRNHVFRTRIRERPGGPFVDDN